MSALEQEVTGSLKQEVAAILMDYTEKIPEQDYMDILIGLVRFLIIRIQEKQLKFKKNLMKPIKVYRCWKMRGTFLLKKFIMKKN